MRCKKPVITFVVVVGILLLIVVLVRTPSHDREWQPFQSVMSDAAVTTDTVTLTNVRDWQHTATTTYSKSYIDTLIISDDDVQRVWFTVQPFAAVDAIGHTMLTFELKSGDAYTFSIEARRENDEDYSSFLGAFNQYELLYSWGTARDFLGVRLFFLGDDLYHYPLDLTKKEAWYVLQYVAAATARVHDTPQFYNTLTANCTNLLAKAVNQETLAATLPYGLAWNLPGWSDQYLQRHGYLDASYDVETIRHHRGLQQFVEELQTVSLNGERSEFYKLVSKRAMELLE